MLTKKNIKVFTTNKNGIKIIERDEDKKLVANAIQNVRIDWHNRLGHNSCKMTLK